MYDRDFLLWLHSYLTDVYNESENVDFLCKLRSIAAATPKEQITPNTGPPLNEIERVEK